jgi:hypothetical protein
MIFGNPQDDKAERNETKRDTTETKRNKKIINKLKKSEAINNEMNFLT